MMDRQLVRRCRRLLDQVDVPEPFDLLTFCRTVAERRGRPLRLVRMSHPHQPGWPTGAWVATSTEDVICVVAGTTELHQHHIALHELGHILWAHLPALQMPEAPNLFPDLDPAAVRRSLQRTHYSTRHEQEAEMLATVLASRLPRHAVVPSVPVPACLDDEVLQRLWEVIGAGRG